MWHNLMHLNINNNFIQESRNNSWLSTRAIVIDILRPFLLLCLIFHLILTGLLIVIVNHYTWYTWYYVIFAQRNIGGQLNHLPTFWWEIWQYWTYSAKANGQLENQCFCILEISDSTTNMESKVILSLVDLMVLNIIW